MNKRVVPIVLFATFVIAVLIFAATVAGNSNHPRQYPLEGGGYQPTTIHVSAPRPRTSVQPSHYSLARYIQRVHAQGESNSCVGQTLSAMREVHAAYLYALHNGGKTPPAHWFSPSFIWNLATDYQNEPITYNQGFAVAKQYGDSSYRYFPYDGLASQVGYGPSLAAFKDAYAHRFSWYTFVNPSDRWTIQNELLHGRPLGLALQVYSNFYNLFGVRQGTYGSYGGSFEFWHSVTIVGYNAYGVTILNSWGKSWADNGLITVSWNLLRSHNLPVVAAG